MGLRETFEKRATDFAYEILAMVRAGRVDEVPRVGHRPQRSLPRHGPNGVVDPPSVLPQPTSGEPASPIRIPAEKLHVRLDGLRLTNRLWNVLSREGYAVLGDLDGRMFADLTRLRGFGRVCRTELRRLLAGERTAGIPEKLRPLAKLTMSSKIRVLAAKRHVLLADIGLSPYVHGVLSRHGYVVLGDLDGRTPASLVVHEGFGPRCDRELRSALVDGGLVVGPVPKARRRAPRARSHRPQHAGDEPSIVKQDGPTSVAASNVDRTALVEVRPSGEIRIPTEKRQVRLDDLDLSTRLWNVLWREGYVVLGDLDGRKLGHLYQHRGFGRVCLEDLRGVLRGLGIIVVPAGASLRVPAFAFGYRFDELRLSRPVQLFAHRYGLTVLGDMDGVELPPAGKSVIGELTSMIETMTSAGPPESVGLLDHLDAGLGRLKERHREVLIMSFGGTGEMPLKLDEIGRRISVTRQRVRQIQVHALASLPALAGPPFGAALRDLGDRVSAEGADVAAELERSWRKEPRDGAGVPRPWANNGFYLRLLTKLSSVIEAAVFSPTDRAAEGAGSLAP